MVAAQSLFVTGTDTGVGKTWVTCRIIRHLRERGSDAAGFKPVCCGDRDDAIALAEASGISDLDAVNPVWFESPLAPLAAAKREGKALDRRAISERFEALRAAHEWVVIEGAGGWEVPISPSETMADLAVEFDAPVLIVAANRLGALNHALLTRTAIEARGLRCAGIVLNEIETPSEDDLAARTNREVLEAVLPEVPVLKTGFGAEISGRGWDGMIGWGGLAD